LQTFYSFGCWNNGIKTHNISYFNTNVQISGLISIYFYINVILIANKIIFIAYFYISTRISPLNNFGNRVSLVFLKLGFVCDFLIYIFCENLHFGKFEQP